MNENSMCVEFDAISSNESFARIVIAAFIAGMDPTLEEMADIKTAVSEAVTNAIIHGYNGEKGKVCLSAYIKGKEIGVTVFDKGVGIENIEQAREPLYTTRPEDERSGMGFVFMEVFMDELEVKSIPGEGTTIEMKKMLR